MVESIGTRDITKIILYIVIILIICGMLVLAYALRFVDSQTEGVSNINIGSFVLVSTQYSESTETVVINLQYFGDSMDCVTREDFEWSMNGQYRGTVYSVSLADKDSIKLRSGDTIEINLKVEGIPPDAKIVLTHKSGFQVFVQGKRIVRR